MAGRLGNDNERRRVIDRFGLGGGLPNSGRAAPDGGAGVLGDDTVTTVRDLYFALGLD
jgi:hypothetical protein